MPGRMELRQNPTMAFYFSACLLGLGVYVVFPQLDLAFSALFYQADVGFIYKDLPWVQALGDVGQELFRVHIYRMATGGLEYGDVIFPEALRQITGLAHAVG